MKTSARKNSGRETSSYCSTSREISNGCCEVGGRRYPCCSSTRNNHSSSTNSDTAGRSSTGFISGDVSNKKATSTSGRNAPRGGSRSNSRSSCTDLCVCSSSISSEGLCCTWLTAGSSTSRKARRKEKPAAEGLWARGEDAAAAGRAAATAELSTGAERFISSMSRRSNNSRSGSCRYSSARGATRGCDRSGSVFCTGRESVSGSRKKRSDSRNSRNRSSSCFIFEDADSPAQRLHEARVGQQQHERESQQKQQRSEQRQQQCSRCSATDVRSSATDIGQNNLLQSLKQQQRYDTSPLAWQQTQYHYQQEYQQDSPSWKQEEREEAHQHLRSWCRRMWQQQQHKRKGWVFRPQQEHEQQRQPQQQQQERRQHEQHQQRKNEDEATRQQWHQQQQGRRKGTFTQETFKRLPRLSLSEQDAFEAAPATTHQRPGTAGAAAAGEGVAATALAACRGAAAEAPRRGETTTEAACPREAAPEFSKEATTGETPAPVAVVTRETAAAPVVSEETMTARAAAAKATPGASATGIVARLIASGRSEVIERSRTAAPSTAGTASRGTAPAPTAAAAVSFEPNSLLRMVLAVAGGMLQAAARGARPLAQTRAATTGSAASADLAARRRATGGVGVGAVGGGSMLWNADSRRGVTECTYTAAKSLQKVAPERLGIRALCFLLFFFSVIFHVPVESPPWFLNSSTVTSLFFPSPPSGPLQPLPSLLLSGEPPCKCYWGSRAPVFSRLAAGSAVRFPAPAVSWCSSLGIATPFPARAAAASTFSADGRCSCFAAAAAPVGRTWEGSTSAARPTGGGGRHDGDGGFFLFAAASQASNNDDNEVPSWPNTAQAADKGEATAEATRGAAAATSDTAATGEEGGEEQAAAGGSATTGGGGTEERGHASDNADAPPDAEHLREGEQASAPTHPSASPSAVGDFKGAAPPFTRTVSSSSTTTSERNEESSSSTLSSVNEESPVVFPAPVNPSISHGVGDAAAAGAPPPGAQQQLSTTSLQTADGAGAPAASRRVRHGSSSEGRGRGEAAGSARFQKATARKASRRKAARAAETGLRRRRATAPGEAKNPEQGVRDKSEHRREGKRASGGGANRDRVETTPDAAGGQESFNAEVREEASNLPAPLATRWAGDEGGNGAGGREPEGEDTSGGGGGEGAAQTGSGGAGGVGRPGEDELDGFAPFRMEITPLGVLMGIDDEDEELSESDEDIDEDDEEASDGDKDGGALAALSRAIRRGRRRSLYFHSGPESSKQLPRKGPTPRLKAWGLPNFRRKPQRPPVPRGAGIHAARRKRGVAPGAEGKKRLEKGTEQGAEEGRSQDSGSAARREEVTGGATGENGGSEQSLPEETPDPRTRTFGLKISSAGKEEEEEGEQQQGGESGQRQERQGGEEQGRGGGGEDEGAAGGGPGANQAENIGAGVGEGEKWTAAGGTAAGGHGEPSDSPAEGSEGPGAAAGAHKYGAGESGEVPHAPAEEATQALRGSSRRWRIPGQWSRHLGLAVGPAGLGPVRDYLMNLSTAKVARRASEGQTAGAGGREDASAVSASGGAAAEGAASSAGAGEPLPSPQPQQPPAPAAGGGGGLNVRLPAAVLQRRRWYTQHRHRLRIRLEERKARLDQHRPLSAIEKRALKSIFLINQFQRHHMLNLQAVRGQPGSVAALPNEEGSVGLFLVNECVAIRYADYPPHFPGYDTATDSCRCPARWTACSKTEAASTPHSWEPIVRETPGTKCTATGGQVMLKNMHAYSCSARDYVQPPHDAPPVPVYVKDKQCRAAEFVLCKAVVSHCFTGPWSAWTQCSTPCGDGYQYRWRKEVEATLQHLHEEHPQPCAPYHMEERRKCNLGVCPQTVTDTHCHWTQVQIDRMDYPYDETRHGCKCGSGDPDFDRAEGGGFMVPCTPEEALASMDNWIDLLQNFCQSLLKNYGKWGSTMRLHPYAHLIKVGLANRWYVDCTGGWGQFDLFEDRMFCGKGVNILCRPETDNSMKPFGTRLPSFSPPSAAISSYLHLGQASSSHSFVHSFTSSTASGWEETTFLLLSLACGCAAAALLLTCFLKRSLLLRYWRAHLKLSQQQQQQQRPQQQQHERQRGRVVSGDVPTAGERRKREQRGGAAAIALGWLSCVFARMCASKAAASVPAAKEKMCFFWRRCLCRAATAAAHGCRRALLLLAVHGHRRPAYAVAKLQQQLVRYVRAAEERDARSSALRRSEPFFLYRPVQQLPFGEVAVSPDDSSHEEGSECEAAPAARGFAAAAAGVRGTQAAAAVAHEDFGEEDDVDPAAFFATQQSGGKKKGMLLPRHVRHRERHTETAAADQGKSRGEETASHLYQSSSERTEKRALRRRRHSSTCSENTRGSTRSTSNESETRVLNSSGISGMLMTNSGSSRGGRDCPHRRSSTNSSSSTHASRDTPPLREKRRKFVKSKEKGRRNVTFAASDTGSSARAEEMTLRERITAFGARRGLSPVETLLLYPRLVLLLRKEKAKKQAKEER